jgi:PAS domain S-box-containing protein
MIDHSDSSSRSAELPTSACARPVPDLSFAQFRALANSMPNLAWMADADGWLIWYNDRWYDYTGTTPDQMVGWGWQSVHHPDVLPEMLRRWTTALKSGEAFEMTFPLRRGSDGSYRMFMTRAEPLREDGGIVGWLGTNTDITEMERTTERLQLVINELNHRVKNTLATVLSIAQHTFTDVDPETYEKFEERLLALARVHDALTREGWSTAQLRELVEHVLETFGSNRFIVDGPPLSVQPRIASALAMTLHELCTNAAKYGSLSTPQGVVNVRWATTTEGARRWLDLFWNESGGPLVTTPSRSGFGLKLIKPPPKQAQRWTIALKRRA